MVSSVSSFHFVFMLNLNFWINKISWFRHQKPYEKILCENFLQPCPPLCEFSSRGRWHLVSISCWLQGFLSMCDSLQMHVTWRLSIALTRLGHPWLLVHPLPEFFNPFGHVLFLVFRLSLSSQGWPQTCCIDENELLIPLPLPPQGWIAVCHLTLSTVSFFLSACVCVCSCCSCVCSCVEVQVYACHFTHVVVKGQTPASVGLTFCLVSNRSLVFTAVYIRLTGPSRSSNLHLPSSP